VLTDPTVCSAILCNYSKLKQDSWGNFESDTWYLIYDFENICDKALEDYPLYMKIVEYKIDGM
jgi:antirestriction protein